MADLGKHMKASRAGSRSTTRAGERLEPRLVLAGPTDTVGDTLSTAADLNPFTYGIAFGTSDTAVENPEDVDLFRVDLLAGDQLNVDVASLPNEGSTPLTALLRVFDEQGAQLTFDQGTPETAAVLSFEAITSGSFFVGVSGFFHTAYDPQQEGVCVPGTPPGFCTGLSTGPYTLNALVEGGIDPVSDDTLAMANPVEFSFGEAAAISNSIDTAEDVDLFALVLVEGNEVSAALDTQSGGSALAGLLRAFDSDGRQVAASTAADPTLAFTAVADGVYYIGISDQDNDAYDPEVAASGLGNTTGAYDLSILVEVGTPFSDADTLDTAVQVDVTPGEEIEFSRKLNTALDVDLFRMELIAGDQLTVDVDAESIGSLLDSLLRVFDADGNPLALADDDEGNDPRLPFAVPTDGVYYVGISGFCNTTYDPRSAGSGSCDAASTGRYNMSILIDRPLPDDGDNTLAEATQVQFTPGVVTPVAGAIEHELDADLYRLQLVVGDVVTLDLDAASIGSTLDGLLRVFDAAGTEVFVNDNSDGLDPALSYTAETSGTFYVGVSAACNTTYNPTIADSGDCDSGTTGDYTLNVLVDTPPPPADDGDNTLATATVVPFTSGVPNLLTGAIDPPTDVDLIRLELGAGDTVTLDLDARSNGSALDGLLRIFDAAGNELVADDNTDGLDPRLSFTAETAGAYFVGLSASCNATYDPNIADSGSCDSGSTGDYSLNVLVQSPPPPVNDGDSTPATATLVPFTPGVLQEFNGTIDPVLDADLFRLELAAGDRVHVDVETPDVMNGLNALLRVFDAAGNQLFVNDDADGLDPRLSFTADMAGTFFVGVSSSCNAAYDPTIAGSGQCDTGTTGDYALNITVENPPPPPVDDGDSTLATANLVTFTPGEPTTRQRAIDPQLDVDLFRLELVAGDEVTFEVTAAAGSTLDSLLRVFSDTGVPLPVSGNPQGENPSVSFTAGQAGTFFVGVSAACNSAYDPRAAGSGTCDAGTTGAYSFNLLVARDPGPLEEAEPNDTIATANALEIGRTAEGALATAADVDFFAVTIDQPGRLTAAANVAGVGTTGRLSLHAADGRLLVTSVGAARVNPHLTPGTYYLAVAADAAGATYELTTEFAPSESPRSNLAIGEGPADVALADFNADGVLDLVAVNQFEFPAEGNISILIGLGDGTFGGETRLNAGDEPTAVVTADFNADGHVDLAVTSLAGVSILLGLGDGTFEQPEDATAGAAPGDLAVGDFNEDNVPDLAVSNTGSDDVSILLGRGDGTFLPQSRLAAGDEPVSIVVADLNNDGLVDLATANRGSDDVSVLLSLVGGGFAAARQFDTGNAPSAAVVLDFNGDGQLDLATADAAGNRISLLPGDGAGNFADAVQVSVESDGNTVAAGRFKSALSVGDFNQDGIADLTLSNSFQPMVTVLLGQSDGAFQIAGRAHVGAAPESIAMGDVNGNGRLDLVTGNFDSGTASVRLGRGNGTFEEDLRVDTGRNPRDLAAADFDSDGQLDLLSANFASLSVLPGAGDGTVAGRLRFSADEPSSVVVDDFNGDGRPDVAAAGFSSGNIQVWLGLGDGTLAPPLVFAAGDRPLDVVSGDFNGDGLIDLAMANSTSGDVSLLLGAGDGTFAAPTRFAVGAQPRALVAADLNGDGRLDLAVADGTDDDVTVLLGAGDGTFTVSGRLTVGDQPRSIIAADMTGDGVVDLATANADSDTISLLRGLGGGNFAASVALAVGDEPRSLAAGDFNGDGLPDLVSANADSDDVSILLGQGAGAFGAQQRFSVGGVPGAVVVGDFNADGRLDVAATSETGDELTLLLGRGDGSFLDPPRFAGHVFQATPLLTDVGADGTLDALLVSQSGDILLRRGRADMPATYDSPVVVNPARPALAMTLLTSGATTRLAAIDRTGDTVSIYALDPDGKATLEQTLQTGNLPRRIAAADVNGDGLIDIVTLNAGSADVSVFLADAGGGFSAADAVPVGVDAGDLLLVDTGGGGVDILLTNQISGDFTLLVNSGAGQFSPQGTFRAGAGAYAVVDAAGSGSPLRSLDGTSALAVGDFDDDGKIDVVTAGGGSNTLSYLPGVAGGWANPLPLPSGDLPSEIITADFDGDGQLDMAVLNEGTADISIFMGDGNGSFRAVGTFPAGNAATGLTAADTDLDGILDLLVGNRFGDLMTLMGRGDGSFAPFTRAGRNVALAVADLDGDGRQDWIVANESLDRVSVQTGDPAAGTRQLFEQQREDGLLAPEAVEIVDLNGDGHADMLVANSGANELLVYMGDGRGQFGDAHRFHAGTNPSGITVADVNGDGRHDVLIANAGSNDVSVLLGDADSLLKPGVRLDVGQGPVETEVGDFNGDGTPDLLVVNSGADNVAMLLGLGRGFFDDQNPTFFPTASTPGNLITGQFDAKAGLDFVTTNSRSGNLTYYSNFGSLAASARLDIAVGGVAPVASAAADFNNDGMLDLVVANNGSGSISLLLGGEGGLSLSDVFVDLGLLHPTDLVLAELGQGEGLRLLVTDEGDELVRVFSPEDFLPLESPEPSPLPGGDSPGFDSGTLLTFFQTVFTPSLISGAATGGVLTSLVTIVPDVISSFDRLFDFDAGDDGSGMSVSEGFGQFIDTVADVSQRAVHSLLVGVNDAFGTDLTTDDISEAIDELISMYLYGPRWEGIAGVVRALLDSFSRHETQMPGAVDEVLSDETNDPMVDIILDDVTGAGQTGQSPDDGQQSGRPVTQPDNGTHNSTGSRRRKNTPRRRPIVDDSDAVAHFDWNRWTTAMTIAGAGAVATRRRRRDESAGLDVVPGIPSESKNRFKTLAKRARPHSD